jgi:hypothetical protein
MTNPRDRDAGEKCQSCGVLYREVYKLPDDIWAAISPKPDVPGAGLLCFPCADDRARRRGIELFWIGSIGDYRRSWT